MVKLEDKPYREYLIMVDKNNNAIQIDWINGGAVIPAQQQEFITAWTFQPDKPDIVDITIQNMKAIIQMNLGLGLRIAKMKVNIEFEEYESKTNEPDTAKNLVH